MKLIKRHFNLGDGSLSLIGKFVTKTLRNMKYIDDLLEDNDDYEIQVQ